MNIKDMIMRDVKKIETVGKFCVDLTDPITGKVKDRVNGFNHAFKDVIAMQFLYNNYCYNWLNTTYGVPAALLCLNDDSTPIDVDIPFLRGQTIGYGRPSQGSSGLFRGAYNAGNQILGAFTPESIKWKFQYDFTPPQANGVMKNIGLTNQYHMSAVYAPANSYPAKNSDPACVSDGRYAYSCSTDGIITRYDLWNKGATVTIDVSAIVGTLSSSYKLIGFSPRTGKYYIFVASSTAANRKMYVFSNKDFNSLETTYSPTNISIGSNGDMKPLYIYGNFMYYMTGTSKVIFKADFVNNASHIVVTLPSTVNNTMLLELGSMVAVDTYIATLGMPQGVLMGANGNYNKGVLFNPDTDSIAAEFYGFSPNGVGAACHHPTSENKLYCYTSNLGILSVASAFTSQVLPTPVTKTAANGMTATYELEVFW